MYTTYVYVNSAYTSFINNFMLICKNYYWILISDIEEELLNSFFISDLHDTVAIKTAFVPPEKVLFVRSRHDAFKTYIIIPFILLDATRKEYIRGGALFAGFMDPLGSLGKGLLWGGGGGFLPFLLFDKGKKQELRYTFL